MLTFVTLAQNAKDMAPSRDRKGMHAVGLAGLAKEPGGPNDVRWPQSSPHRSLAHS